MAEKVSDRRYAESKHRYTDPRTRERVIGVTTVIGCFDSGNKLQAGAYAAYNLAQEGKHFRTEWDAKRDLGTRVHSYVDLWMNGRAAEVQASDEMHMDHFADFCREEKPEWIAAERPVVSSLGYGGRFDGIGYFRDAFYLVDLKTGKQYPKELAMQLAAYRYCDGMILYDEKGWARDLEEMPHVDRCAGLYLTEDGWDLVEVPADQASLEAFVHLLTVKQWAARFDKEMKQK
jgi:hypothetical protein